MCLTMFEGDSDGSNVCVNSLVKCTNLIEFPMVHSGGIFLTMILSDSGSQTNLSTGVNMPVVESSLTL
ncbi:hypothetical protein [Frog virus 3]|uniref:Uncharacterized protein n=1 Tax=Frog virus 3 TaxID=10493 RepID=A0A3G2Y370_FRG3V|nr:hypothetical protein [Frog virus 3]